MPKKGRADSDASKIEELTNRVDTLEGLVKTTLAELKSRLEVLEQAGTAPSVSSSRMVSTSSSSHTVSMRVKPENGMSVVDSVDAAFVNSRGFEELWGKTYKHPIIKHPSNPHLQWRKNCCGVEGETCKAATQWYCKKCSEGETDIKYLIACCAGIKNHRYLHWKEKHKYEDGTISQQPSEIESKEVVENVYVPGKCSSTKTKKVKNAQVQPSECEHSDSEDHFVNDVDEPSDKQPIKKKRKVTSRKDPLTWNANTWG